MSSLTCIRSAHSFTLHQVRKKQKQTNKTKAKIEKKKIKTTPNPPTNQHPPKKTETKKRNKK